MHISKYKNILLMLFILVISRTTVAGQLEAEMAKASANLSNLMPYIYNDDAFRKEENKAAIQSYINELIEVVNKTPNLMEEHAVSLEISQQSLLNQLKQSKVLFESGSYSTAQYLLAGVPVICSSCHIQDGQQAKMTRKMDRSLFADDFSYGEFNYYLRNYSEAEKAYTAHLKKSSIQKSRIQASKTLERLLDITIINNDDFSKADTLIESSEKLPKLDMDVVQTLDLWKQGLKSIDNTPKNLDSLENAIYQVFNEEFTLQHEFIFEEKNRPLALYWRKQLHKQLRKNPTDRDTARALYLLSIMERTLGDQIDISLANLYLKECVLLNVKEYSSKCLNEYENHLHFYFGGSNGESLPGSVAKELADMKKHTQKEI